MIKHFFIILFVSSLTLPLSAADNNLIKKTIDESILPLMVKQEIPGMAVGIILDGKTHVFNYGVSTKDSKEKTSDKTLFEIGSISKTFSAVLLALAEENQKLNLNDPVEKHLVELKNTDAGKISLINLATHVTGGFPLQVPDNIKNHQELIYYFKQWKPTHPLDSHRTYANPSIGLLGLVLAKNMNTTFPVLVEYQILKKLNMNETYFEIPSNQFANYAQGYTRTNKPARMSPGILAIESYGIKTSIKDMVKFLQANLLLTPMESKLEKAISKTHDSFYKVGAMTQLMVWEQYTYPSKLEDLLYGNSTELSMKANPVVKISPPIKAQENILINKTGSTNGFGAYIVLIPNLKTGIVLLANKNYPNEERVKTAYEILTRLLK